MSRQYNEKRDDISDKLTNLTCTPFISLKCIVLNFIVHVNFQYPPKNVNDMYLEIILLINKTSYLVKR